MKLNLGCQVHYFEGWTNVDIIGDDPGIKVDLVADVGQLPTIADESVDFIYAGHLVEHFYPDTIHDAIREWFRVLKKGGKLVIVTPDCGAVFKDYAAGKFNIEATWQQIYGRINHYDTPSERHHIAFDREKLWEICMWATAPKGGWTLHEALDFNRPPADLVPFMDTHISRGAYQLGIVLTK